MNENLGVANERSGSGGEEAIGREEGEDAADENADDNGGDDPRSGG